MIALRHRLYLAGAVMTGIAIGAAWPPPPLPKTSDSASTWSLPKAADIARHSPQDLATATSDMRWNGDAGSLMGEGSTWRLAGIVHDNRPAILVMTTDSNSKAQRVAINETLPDGSILQSIGNDRASTKHDDCIKTYQLFQAQPVDKSDGCEEPSVTDQGTSK